MQQIQGVIDGISTKTVRTKFGDKDVYHADINGQDVNLGFKCPYVVGESVTLDVEHKYGSLQAINPPPKANGASVSPGNASASRVQAVATAVPFAPAAEFPVAKNTKGITIARQNSGNHAAAIVCALIAAGKVKTQPEALEAFMDLAYEITDFATGHREVNEAAAIQAYEDADE